MDYPKDSPFLRFIASTDHPKQTQNNNYTNFNIMKKVFTITFVILFTAAKLSAQSSFTENDLSQVSPAPSAKTQQKIEQITDQPEIGTRQAPDEPGWAQKETPIEKMNVTIIISLLLISMTYYYKKKQTLKSNRK